MPVQGIKAPRFGDLIQSTIHPFAKMIKPLRLKNDSASGFIQDSGDPQGQIQDGKMLINAVDEPLVNFGEDHDNLALLLI